MKKGNIVLLSIAIIIVAIVMGAWVYIYHNILNVDTIYKGVNIDKYHVGDKTMEQALEYIKEIKEEEINGKSMKLIYKNKEFKIKLKQLEFTYEYKDAILSAYEQGRRGTPFARLKKIIEIKQGVEIPLKPIYRVERVEEIANSISKLINNKAVDAKMNFHNGSFSFEEEVIGEEVYIEELIEDIHKNIYLLQDIYIKVEDIKPKLTKAFLSRINGVIGEFTTSFKGSSKGRIENIRLSANAISNKLILPSEEFSYNNTTGPRAAQFGYQEANIIIGGELTPGLGGGVCQTSTTMYNALLLGDLTIIERHPHSIPAAYVPYGQDAAVSYGYLDLKFRNDFDFPIYTYAKVIGHKITIYIYGDTLAKPYIVKIKPEIVETLYANTQEIIDPTLKPGEKITIQKGRTGYKVKTYKTIIKEGKVISKKQISTDHYRKKDLIYKINPKEELNYQDFQ